MNIGIIGAGQIGSTLTRRLSALGHKVFIANSRGPETLTELAKETGAIPVTASQAARSGELVVVTIPMKNVCNLPKDLFAGVSWDVVVVDTCNYYPKERDGEIEAIENGMSESRYVESQIGHPVMKAFNNIFAEHLLQRGRAKGDAHRIALPVAGDDQAPKAVLMRLIDEMGFDAVDAGRLDESWRQEPGKPVYARDFNATGVREALQSARPVRDAEWTARQPNLAASA